MQIIKFLVVGLLLCLAPVAAHGQTKQEKHRARNLQAEGLQLMQRGQNQEALQKFQSAYDLVPSPKILFNLAKAHVALGNAVDAHLGFSRFLNEAIEVPPEARAEAERSLKQLHTQIAFLTATGEPNVTLFIDGEKRGTTPLPEPLPLSPGPHEVRAERDGVVLVEETLPLAAGMTTTLPIRARPPEVAAPPPVAIDAPAEGDADITLSSSSPREDQPANWKRRMAWGTGAASAVSLGFGVFQHFRANAKYKAFDDVEDAPLTTTGECTTWAPQDGGGRCSELRKEGDGARTAAIIGFSLAGALAATSAWLFYASDRQQEASLARACVVDPIGARINCQWVF